VFGKAIAEALLGDSEAQLPIAPTEFHSERFAGIKQLFYEFGATVTHGIKNRTVLF
jgi:hypothetical protein